jgi:probable phosphoglycerate mutase
MTKIILVRHGETQGNREGLFRGQADFPLNENGLRQARDLAQALKKYELEAVYSSPLSRARVTAELIARSHNLKIEMEPGFNNIKLGLWEGVPKDEIAERFPELWELWVTRPEYLQIPEGETLDAVQVRASKALKRIVKEQRGKTLAVVTHRAVLKPLLAWALGIPKPYFWKLHIDTSSYSILEHTPKRGYTLTLLNETLHLKEFVRETV